MRQFFASLHTLNLINRWHSDWLAYPCPIFFLCLCRNRKCLFFSPDVMLIYSPEHSSPWTLIVIVPSCWQSANCSWRKCRFSCPLSFTELCFPLIKHIECCSLLYISKLFWEVESSSHYLTVLSSWKKRNKLLVLCTGWHISLIQTSRWHQNKSSGLAWPAPTWLVIYLPFVGLKGTTSQDSWKSGDRISLVAMDVVLIRSPSLSSLGLLWHTTGRAPFSKSQRE